MKENWIKIYEIEYTPEELSKVYKNINNDNTNLEELVKDNFMIQELKKNLIPYRCRWDERILEIKSEISTARIKQIYHYFVEILILESYKPKYDKILNNIEKDQSNIEFSEAEELKNVNIDDSNEYKEFENVKKAFTLLLKSLLIISLCCIIYIIIKSTLN